MNRGEELKIRIDNIGLKVNFLAEMIGKSPSYVSKLISGDIVSYDNMAKLKKIINKYEDEIVKTGLLTK